MSQLVKAKQTGQFTIYGTDYNTKDGTAVRDYVHIDEICKAIALAIEKPANSTENLGHGHGYTVKEIVDQFQFTNSCNFEVLSGPRRQGDLESSVLDKPSKYMNKLYDINELLAI
jgi:UDP-glucose 4-epimerase